MRERENDKERERKGKRPLKVDTFLSAPDLLARHFLVRRDSAVPETHTGQGTKNALSTSNNVQNCFHILYTTIGVFDILYLGLISFHPALMRPFRGGTVTHNGVAVYRETVLKPGDVIGLGDYFLFLYRDPRVTPAPPLALTLPWQVDVSTTCCPSGLVDRQETLRHYLGSTEAILKFHPRHADSLLQVRQEDKQITSTHNISIGVQYRKMALITYVYVYSLCLS